MSEPSDGEIIHWMERHPDDVRLRLLRKAAGEIVEPLEQVIKDPRSIIVEENQRKKLYEEGDPRPLPSAEEFEPRQEPEKILGRIIDKLSLAERFLVMTPLYYDEASIFWAWDWQSRYWRKIDETELLNWIDSASSVNIVTSKERQELLNAFKQVSRRKRPKDMSELGSGQNRRNLVQFRKELVDLETGERIPSTPQYFCTNPLPHRLGTGSPSKPDVSKFDKLFKEWVGEKEAITLYEVLAYCMLPQYPIERIIVLHGSGSNGKSCFLKILRTFIGEHNITSTSLDTLLGSRFELARLHKKLVCEMGETNLQSIENTQIIKRLVSGKDLIPIEYKNRGLTEMVNYAKLLIATNNIPTTEDKTDGFYRRFLIVDFPNRFEKEIDVLSELTEQDYESLADYCLGILFDILKRRGFSNEGGIDARRERYEEKSNPFDKFFKEYIDDSDPNSDIPKWEFDKRLNEYLKEKRQRAMSDMAIAKIMKNKTIQEVRIRKDWYENNERVERMVRCWGGIKWRL